MIFELNNACVIKSVTLYLGSICHCLPDLDQVIFLTLQCKWAALSSANKFTP